MRTKSGRRTAAGHFEAIPAERRRRRWSAAAFLSYGFRPFFLSAALWAALSIALWLFILRGQLTLPSRFDPVTWHAHEALFGYLGAVMSGFVLTAVPSWTGRPRLAGWPLLALLVLWVLGRVCVASSQYFSPWIVLALDCSCLTVVAGIALREIVAAKNWRNLIVVAMLGLFVLANAVFHSEAARFGYAAAGYGLRLGLAVAVFMISLIGGRIVPAFTRNWLVKRDKTGLPSPFGRVDAMVLGLTLLALICWVAMPHRVETGVLLLACGLAQFARLSRWRGLDTGSEPLVWILHVGYALVPAGMLAIGAAAVWPGALMGAAAQHLWMAGAIGVMTLAVMTRASLGHTGRPLSVGVGTTTLYILVFASVLARLVGSVHPPWALWLWTLSAICWSCGFAGFAVLYGPFLIRPRSANRAFST